MPTLLSRSMSAPHAALPFLSLLLAGVSLSGCSSGWVMYDHEATRIVTMESPGAETLRLVGDVGDMRVVGSPDRTDVRAIVELVGKGSSAESARAALDEIETSFALRGDTLHAGITHPEPPSMNPYGARWSVEVPEGTLVEIVSDVGDVTVVGTRASVDVRTDVGDVWIHGAHGVTVRSDVGDVHVRGTGLLDLRSDVGDVVMQVLSTSNLQHRVTTDVGDIRVVLTQGWSGTVDAVTDVGDTLIDGGPCGRARGDGTLALRPGDGGSATLLARTDVGDVHVAVGDTTDAMGPEPERDVPDAEDSTARDRSIQTTSDRP